MGAQMYLDQPVQLQTQNGTENVKYVKITRSSEFIGALLVGSLR